MHTQHGMAVLFVQSNSISDPPSAGVSFPQSIPPYVKVVESTLFVDLNSKPCRCDQVPVPPLPRLSQRARSAFIVHSIGAMKQVTLVDLASREVSNSMASSTTKQLVFQLNEALLKEQQRTENDDSSNERILDIINRLDKIENIDDEILEETKIAKTVYHFRKNYSEAISRHARALRKKWKKIYEDAKRATSTSTNQNNVEEMKVSSNSNDMEIDNGDNRDASNGDSDDMKEGNFKTCDDEDGIDNNSTTNEQQDNQAGNTKMSCDICSKEANFRADIGQLQRCKDCGIYVHELCYCLVPTDKLDPNFTCHACKAVGTTVEVNVPSRIGGTGKKMGKNREQMTVDERPMECALCFHKSEYHAMHPLYDTDGKEGRQYVLKATRSGIGGKPRRLAWVHTLCAQMLCVNKNYLCGVDGDGDYEDDNGSVRDSASDEEANAEGDESDSDEEVGGQKYELGRKIYKYFIDDNGRKRIFKGKVVHFSKRTKYYKIKYTDGDSEDMTELEVKKHLQKPTPNSELDTSPVAPNYVATRNFCINMKEMENITYSREKLKCAICGLDDTNSTRIVTQCNVGDDGVDEDLTQYYSDAMKETECRSAMHVGCELILLLCFV